MSTTLIPPVTKRPDFNILQPATTFTGAPIVRSQKGLPKTTQSLCPECRTIIDARIFEENGRVMMEKACPEHGEFRDCVYSDVNLYLKMEEWEFGDNRGLSIPRSTREPKRFARTTAACVRCTPPIPRSPTWI